MCSLTPTPLFTPITVIMPLCDTFITLEEQMYIVIH